MIRVRLQLGLKSRKRLGFHWIVLCVRVEISGGVIYSADARQGSQHVVERTVLHHQDNDMFQVV